jgi:hypothetical protein
MVRLPRESVAVGKSIIRHGEEEVICEKGREMRSDGTALTTHCYHKPDPDGKSVEAVPSAPSAEPPNELWRHDANPL